MLLLAILVTPLALLPLVSAECAISPDGSGHVEILASWTSIGDSAFYQCSSLKSLSFESGSQLTTIGDNAFYNSDLSGSTLLEHQYYYQRERT